MGAMLPIETADGLPALVDRAAAALTSARSSAEVLDARDLASFAYDVAKKTARLAAAKGAHDSLIAAAHRSQAHALEIEAAAKRRLADEYDTAQGRGEVAGPRDGNAGRSGGERPASVADLGLTRKAVHEARQIRDAEVASPGIVRRALDAALERREEPSKAALRQAVLHVAQHGYAAPLSARRNPLYQPDPAYDLVVAVAGACRTVLDKSHDVSGARLLNGCADAAMRERTIATLRACRDRLQSLLENSDAAEA